MRLIVLVIILLSLNLRLEAQIKYRKLKVEPPSKMYSEKVLAIEKKNHTCVRINTKSFSTRTKIFPFNKAAQVQLVSFKGSQLPNINDSAFYTKLEEIKTLNLRQIDSLTDIMYNVGFGGTILLIEELACYDPRNAILFINSERKIFAYIEICFECMQMVTTPENIEVGDFCNEKFYLLKQRFINAGISYGTLQE